MVDKLKAVLATAIGISTLASAGVQAYEAGDMIVRAGLTYVSPDDESAATAAPAPLAALAGADIVDVEEGISLGFSGTYMVNKQFGVELLLALPFVHDIQGYGPLNGLTVGEAQHLPPTLSAQVYPDIGVDKVQPYFGIGVNYTTFFSEELDGGFKTALSDVYGLTATGLEIDDSLSYAFQAGLDVEVAKNCYVNAAYWYIDIESEATVKTNGGDINIDVAIDPHVFMVGAAYKF